MNWINLMKKYAGKWVALKDDQKTVIASADSAKQALKMAKEKGVENPFLNFVPEKLTAFAGHD